MLKQYKSGRLKRADSWLSVRKGNYFSPHTPVGGTKDTTTTESTDDATLYDNVLTIQNAADLECLRTPRPTLGVRGEFLLGIFLLDPGGKPHFTARAVNTREIDHEKSPRNQ